MIEPRIQSSFISTYALKLRRGEERTNRNAATKFALGMMGLLTISALFATPVFANPIGLSGTNNGSSTGGGIVETGFGSTGAHTSAVMGVTVFTFTGLSPRSFFKVAAGTDNFLVNLSGVGTNTVSLDLTVTTPSGTDSGVSASGTAGNGQYTFNILSTHGGSVTTADTVTITVHCNVASTIACGSITFGWGGATSSDNLLVQVPEGTGLANPTLTTALSSTTITAGGSVHDTATLAGATNPTGTITFFVSTTNTCPNAAATPVLPPAVVTANGAYTSGSLTFSTAGTFYWYAVYSGDANNHGVVSACEPLVVNPVTTGAPEFPMGMLAIVGLVLPALVLIRRYSGLQGPTY